MGRPGCWLLALLLLVLLGSIHCEPPARHLLDAGQPTGVPGRAASTDVTRSADSSMVTYGHLPAALGE
jgi:hypothetical protein